MTSVMVVLGKGISKTGALSRGGKRTVQKAVESFKSSHFDIVVMSGRWSYAIDYIPDKTESQAMKEYAVKLGIPSKSLIVEDKSMDTLGNAYYSKKLLDKIGKIASLTVVTTDLHVARSKYIFLKVFGPKMKISFISTSTDYLNDEQTRRTIEHEKKSLAEVKRALDHMPAGYGLKLEEVLNSLHYKF